MTIKHVAFIIVVGFFSFAQAEYIVFEKINGQITGIASPEKYAQIYDILMKYQWPANIASFSSMTKDEIRELTTQNKPRAEELFIRKKLQELDPTLDIAFVPTVLYELFFIYYKKTNRFFLETYVAFDSIVLKKIAEKTIVSLQDVLHQYVLQNNQRNTIMLHQKINNTLIDYIGKDSFLNPLVMPDFIAVMQKLLTHLSAEITLTIDLGTAILQTEYNAHQKNNGLLYRATTPEKAFFIPGKATPSIPLEPTIPIKDISSYSSVTAEQLQSEAKIPLKNLKYKYTDWDVPTRSISYGNSLFGGYFYDDGACVYSIMQKNPHLYTLLIDKFAYATGGKITELFFIPPLNTLVSLRADGEFFHPRTISYYKSTIPNKASAIIQGLSYVKIGTDLGIFIREGDPLKMGYELSDFITKNAVILSGSPDLLVGQKYFTELLKTMVTLNKNLKPKDQPKASTSGTKP